MFRNASIRTKILAGVVIVNLLGAAAVVVYLHQAYSGAIDTEATVVAVQGAAAWDQIKGVGSEFDPVTDPERAAEILRGMKEVTGVEYGLMLDKSVVEQDAYVSAREALGLASNWDERDVYALLATTEGAPEQLMQFAAAPETIPELGKGVGIENGACSKMCHDGLTGEGDYWSVRWSSDSASRAHGVFPVLGAQGEPVGVVYAAEDISIEANDARSSMFQTLTVIAVTLLVATVFIGFLIDSLVFKRLGKMIDSMETISMRLAGGDFDAKYEPSGASDEIGSFEVFFSDFVTLISSTLKSLVKK